MTDFCTLCAAPGEQCNRSPEQRSLLDLIEELAQRFKVARNTAEILLQVEALAWQETAAAISAECECGGTYSVAARPRWGTCAEVLIDSPFHVTVGG